MTARRAEPLLVDVHFHFIPVPEYLPMYRQYLSGPALERAVLLVFSSPGLNFREVHRMVPDMARSFVGSYFRVYAKRSGADQAEVAEKRGVYDLSEVFLRWWRGSGLGSRVVPFIDDREFRTLDEARLEAYRRAGFRGIKTFYIPDFDDAGMEGYPGVLGMEPADYKKRVRAVFDFAAGRGMPVLCHVDLRRNGGVIREALEAHPDLRLDIPHFGYSRPAMGPLLERFDHLYTDISSMMPVMRQKTAGYMEFIEAHRERVMLGTEGLPNSPSTFVEFLRKNLKPDTVERVASANAREYLGQVW